MTVVGTDSSEPLRFGWMLLKIEAAEAVSGDLAELGDGDDGVTTALTALILSMGTWPAPEDSAEPLGRLTSVQIEPSLCRWVEGLLSVFMTGNPGAIFGVEAVFEGWTEPIDSSRSSGQR